MGGERVHPIGCERRSIRPRIPCSFQPFTIPLFPHAPAFLTYFAEADDEATRLCDQSRAGRVCERTERQLTTYRISLANAALQSRLSEAWRAHGSPQVHPGNDMRTHAIGHRAQLTELETRNSVITKRNNTHQTREAAVATHTLLRTVLCSVFFTTQAQNRSILAVVRCH